MLVYVPVAVKRAKKNKTNTTFLFAAKNKKRNTGDIFSTNALCSGCLE